MGGGGGGDGREIFVCVSKWHFLLINVIIGEG